ncbi:bidirectional sugar transporter SWEET4-like [Rutidosis leptorrhynchoides]|uniref:bidirectional sugar transporter SWEET4-like n=1 Tax=Rutidosis leptorrhynchoides TaxID=125765 RepID=UPI003A98FD29
MTMNNMQIRTIVGIIGNVISFVLFISPAPTIWGIFAKKDVEEFSPDPYIACVMNCLLWIFYGLPINHPNSTLVITINAIGLLLELIYLSSFLIHGKTKHRKKIGIWLLVELLALGAIAGVDLGKYHTHTSRSNFVGIFCVVFGIIMYGSPLTIMWKVIKTKSVEFMPFPLSLAAFLNGCCWTAYALLKFDLFILIANGTGAVLGFAQLVLYGCFCGSTPKKSKSVPPTAEVQLENEFHRMSSLLFLEFLGLRFCLFEVDFGKWFLNMEFDYC